MAPTKEEILNSQRNKIIKELIEVGFVKDKPKMDSFYKKPTVCIKKLSDVLNRKRADIQTLFNKPRMTKEFAIILVNLLNDKYNSNLKIKGL